MGRTSDARERILTAGRQLFNRQAFGAVGVAEICTTAGVPKGSFYYFFPSKSDLALEVINEHWVWQKGNWERILGASTSASERLRELFVASAQVQRDALVESGQVCGCLFGNLSLEVSASEDKVRDRLREVFAEQVAMIQATLADDHSDFDPAGQELAPLASAIVAQLEGLVLFAKLFNDPDQVDRHWDTTARMLGFVR